MSGCLLWTAATDRDGYGVASLAGHQYRVNRLAFLVAHGRWPKKLALHTCGNRACANAEHIYDGSHQRNAVDREDRGRANRPHGSAHANAKLTEE